MGKIRVITNVDKNIERLLAIWESAVKKTHVFLNQSDILSMTPEVRQGLMSIKHLYAYFDIKDTIQGFIGVAEQKIEMLFVDATVRGQGIGKELLNFAVKNLEATYVDVNEQNEQGVGFYKHFGFIKISRSTYDDKGRPFPILHLKLDI